MKKIQLLTLCMLVTMLPACCGKCKETCKPCNPCDSQEETNTTKVSRKVVIPVEEAGTPSK